MKLIMKKDYCDASYICTLHNAFNKEQGVIKITIKSNNSGEYGEIDFFCVAKKYRHTKYKYGKQLLNTVVQDIYHNTGITTFIVVPRGEEIYDECEKVMDTDTLYKIYKKLGFEFKNDDLKTCENTMVMHYIS